MHTPAVAAHLHAIMLRDLRALRREVEAYSDDAAVWAIAPGIANSCGTLVLHVAGNLRTYVGHAIGGIAYVRDREREFSARGLSRDELLREIDATIDAVDHALPLLTADVLTSDFPVAIGTAHVNAQEFLMHVATHLAYHLGQVDYHRRITTGSTVTVGTLSPGELSSAHPAAGGSR